MEQAPPPYTSIPASEMTPTAQLDQLLYSNISTPPSSPDYTQAISALPSPPSYKDVVSACTPTTSRSINTMDQTLSRTSMSRIFASCTTRTSRKQTIESNRDLEEDQGQGIEIKVSSTECTPSIYETICSLQSPNSVI
ncbi:hypothetical protein KCU77_g14, partial [Aureobasidium melanogenum]